MADIIVTGTSRGIGEALAERLLAQGHRVIGIARTSSGKLAGGAGGGYTHIEADLGETAGLERLMARAFEAVSSGGAQGVYLVNNAAVLQPLGDVGACGSEAVDRHLRVNLTAPMILSSLFARHTQRWAADKRILNVSSASASILLPGMSAYCTVKAGLDVFAKVMGLEQERQAYPIKVAAVWPGMIETAMQAEIRGQSPDVFPSAEVFIGAMQGGMLTTPEQTAAKLADLLTGPAFPQGEVLTEL